MALPLIAFHGDRARRAADRWAEDVRARLDRSISGVLTETLRPRRPGARPRRYIGRIAPERRSRREMADTSVSSALRAHADALSGQTATYVSVKPRTDRCTSAPPDEPRGPWLGAASVYSPFACVSLSFRTFTPICPRSRQW